MQLHIRHETLYRYGESVKRSVQNLRLTPRRDPVPRALNWTISAPGRQHEQIDAYGNLVHLLTLDEPHREIRIVVNGVVETDDVEGQPLPNDGKLAPLTYLAETPLTRPDPAIQAFAAEYLPRAGERRSAVLKLAGAISETIRYETGATDVHESATKAFARGRGVCQDHAHIFIACCRASGIPARYVSGYVYTEKEGDVASHAWVDAWLGDEGGWMPIDVTHNSLVGGRHCRLAVGRDYLDACPVRGVRRGGGAEEMQVAVIVAASAQQQQQQQQ
ncbi:MAG: transglutaminase domain-containing protein [Povalibacter sp.]